MKGFATWRKLAHAFFAAQDHITDERVEILERENETLREENERLNSSVPPSSDQNKKPSDKSKRKKGLKRGQKYDHPGKTRNGFGEPDKIEKLELENCPVCGAAVDLVEQAPKKVTQVAELVDQPVEIREDYS